MTQKQFHIVAFGAQGLGVSGGDRIFIEIARRLKSNREIHLWVSDEGKAMCNRMNLTSSKIVYHVSGVTRLRLFGSVVFNLALVVTGIYVGLCRRPTDGSVAYSASEFWMDSLPTFFWKLKNKSIHWIASWYQTAPSPFTGFSLTKSPRNRLSALPYWFFQQTTKPFIAKYADIIAVNNAKEVNEFPRQKVHKKIFIMYGAVDVSAIHVFETKYLQLAKKYDAVFQGRFHPQKGVVELIDIWKQVVAVKPHAKLALIGNGPLWNDVSQKIEELGLQNNVILLGYVFDGKKKYTTFMQSKIVVHPAFYDSGGMASAEAMAFGLPCVGFNLPAYRDYYPKGMLKVPQTNLKAFAKAVLTLLNNKNMYKTYAFEAKSMVMKSWSWDTRVAEFEKFIKL